MMNGNFTIRIEMLENGYTVEVPDVDKINEMEKKQKAGKGDSEPSPYYGDCTEKKVAKSTGEVLSIVKMALANLPEAEYDDAFKEASENETE